MKKRVAVLISGKGSNLQALIDASQAPGYPAEIVLVISNNPDAYGLTRAEDANIHCEVINHRDFKTRDEYDAIMHGVLETYDVQIVCLAGFMRLLSESFVQKWEGKLLNIHPSLLPAFKGAHAVRDALAAGVAKTGCTVHFVIPEVDAGPIVLQAEVAVLPGDTEQTLTERIHAEEHRIYPQALAQLILSS